VHGEEVGKLGPGAAFGEIALIDRRPRTATVTAVTDLTTFGLPVFVFRPFVEARPAVAWKLLEAMADRLAAAESR
jgi:CRP/FNR family transcriptional regulator